MSFAKHIRRIKKNCILQKCYTRAVIFVKRRHSLYPYKPLRSGYCSFRTSHDVDRKRIRLGFTILSAKTTEVQNSVVLEYCKASVQTAAFVIRIHFTHTYSHLTNQPIFQNKLHRLTWLFFKHINLFYLISIVNYLTLTEHILIKNVFFVMF